MPTHFSSGDDKSHVIGGVELPSFPPITTHDGHRPLSRPLAYLATSLSLVAAIVVVAMVWVRNSQTRAVAEGPMVRTLWGTHGIHELDLVVLGVEIVLGALLIAVLWRGFTR